MEGFDKKLTEAMIAEQWAAMPEHERESLVRGHWVPEKPRKEGPAKAGMVCFVCGQVFEEGEWSKPFRRPIENGIWGATHTEGRAHITCPENPVPRSNVGHPDTLLNKDSK